MPSAFLLWALTSGLAYAAQHWGYDDKHGPDTWGGACQTGHRQSPVDIHSTDVHYSLMDRIAFGGYDQIGKINITNNGHSVAISGFNNWKTPPYIVGGALNGKYFLQQFHLHWATKDHEGSEHKIGGLAYPAELHLVHLKEGMSMENALHHGDGLAVVGVFLNFGNDGEPMALVNSGLQKVHGYLNETEVRGFRLRSVLPAQTDAFYRYEGSLTTPACSEAVQWIVLAEAISITRQQMSELRLIQNSHGEVHELNFRPVQPLNGRRIRFRPAQYNKQRFCDSAAGFWLWPVLATISARTLF